VASLLSGVRPPVVDDRLRLFRHRDQVLLGDLADQLRMIGTHVSLDLRRSFLNRLSPSEEPALAPDNLRHDLSFDYERDPTVAALQSSAILLAATLTDKGPTRIQLCGRLAVQLAGRELTPKLPGGQARVLFTYLSVNRALPARREQMIEALWPWRAPAGADTSLSALLSRLRGALGDGVLCGRGEIRLELPGDAWIDLEAAEEAIHRAEAAVAQEDWARGWGPALVALFTARRGFLPGEDLPWADEYRRRLGDIRVAALECYASVALGVGGSELAPGERCARELVMLAPFHERAHALLMQIATARGNGADALRVYETLRARLDDELGAAPGPELRELQARLLRR
jgi:SARP family transcriptional regulator, regulator of embCAB operon